MRNRGTQRMSPLYSPRVGEGASGTVPALGHVLLQTSLDGQASGGQGVAPARHQGQPWTRL